MVTPATFKGEYNPEPASRSLKEVMRSFRLAVVPDNFQVEFAAYLLRVRHWNCESCRKNIMRLTILHVMSSKCYSKKITFPRPKNMR